MADGSVTERIGAAVSDGVELIAVHAGFENGWYAALADGPRTADEVAETTGTGPRFTLEWLREQVAAGNLTYDGEQFGLADDWREEALAPDSLVPLLARLFYRTVSRADSWLAAWRNDADGLDPATRHNRSRLQSDYSRIVAGGIGELLGKVPEVAEVVGLPGLRIADVGCGGGHHLRSMAAAWDVAEALGVDPDPEAHAIATAEGGRGVRFVRDTADVLAEHGPFDLVTIIDSLHHMPEPPSVLAAVRPALAPHGVVAVLEAACRPEFSGEPHPGERDVYLSSLFGCLHDRIEADGAAAPGAVVRPAQLAAWADAAGLRLVDSALCEDEGFTVHVLVG